MNRRTAFVLTLMLACSGLASAQIAYIYTYAGNPNGSFPGNGGPATSAIITSPAGLAIDPVGNLYIAASGNSLIRLVNASTSTITTVAGGGTGGDGGLATAAQLISPCDVKLDPWGNLYLSETCTTAQGGGGGGGGGGTGGVARIRRVDAATGIITTVAGGTNSGFAGDGGPATGALLSLPAGLATDATGNIFIADSGNNRIRRIDVGTGYISTVAGNGVAAFAGDGGLATAASLNSPTGVTVDDSGNLYIADMLNNAIRRVDGVTGIITTVAGTGAAGFNGDGIAATTANLNQPVSVIMNSGNLVFADFGNNRVRMIDNSGIIWTIIGNGSATANGGQIGDGAPASLAVLSHPFGLAVRPSEPMFIAELTGGRVREDGLPNSIAATAVTVSSTSVTAMAGTSITLTASLAASNGMASNAGGGVYFVDGTSTLIGSAAIVNGSASMTTSSLAVGVHNITAQYTGSSNFGGSVSPVFALTITNLPPTLSLSANPNPAPANQPVGLTVSISPSSATGTVTFYNGATALGSATLSGGAATLSVSGFAPGTYSLTAQYGGDASNSAAVSPVLSLTVKNSTSIALTSSLNPSTPGQSVTFSAAITPATASGTVQFLDGATVLGTIALAGGSASFSTSALTAGPHSITAVYGGDANNAGSTSSVVSQTVKTSTTTSLISSSNPITLGGSVTFTATVVPASATGTVQFTVYNSGNLMSTVSAAVVGGVATWTTANLSSGSNSVAAIYSGDGNYGGSTSAAVTQMVRFVSYTVLSSSPNPSTLGGTLVLTATLYPANNGQTGSVQFFNGATLMGTGTVGASGVAQLTTTTLPAGTNSLTAAYSGDSYWASSTSSTLQQTVNKVSTTTNLTGSPNPSIVGGAVTLLATVSPSTATGTVQFLDGATVFGTATLASGSASLTVSSLAQGTHSITAAYSGDANNAGSTSAAINQGVNAKTVTTTAVTSSLNPSTNGASVTFTAAVTPSAATGTVQFLDGATVLGTSALANGTASLAVSTLTQGTHSITAVYGGDANNAGGTSSVLSQTVNKLSSSVGITANPAFPTVGQTVNIVAAVSPTAATGAVNFFSGSTLLGTSNLSNGQATFPIQATTAGLTLVNLGAVYQGDPNYSGSFSPVISVNVGKGSTTTALSSSVNPSVHGQAVTFTATVTPAAATGTVTFSGIGTASLANGVASITTSALPTGTTTVSAQYNGDSNYNSSASAGLAQVVKAATTTSLTSGPNPSTFGQTVTLTATVTPSSATGSVQFFNGGTLLGTGTMSSGHASLSGNDLPAGSLLLTAVYSGDANNASSTSAVRVQTVNKANSTTRLPASPSSGTVGQSVTFMATVSPASGTGTVEFTDNGTVLATITVSGGTAVFSTSSLASGPHPMKAIYSGDANANSSQSSTLNYKVH